VALTLDPLVEVRQAPANEVLSLRQVVRFFGWEAAKKNPEVRRFLQVLGTDAVRAFFGEDTWIKLLMKEALARRLYTDSEGWQNVVITDVRFSNEAKWVKEQGGVIWRINRPGHTNEVGTAHSSEKSINDIHADMYIYAGEGVQCVYDSIDEVMRSYDSEAQDVLANEQTSTSGDKDEIDDDEEFWSEYEAIKRRYS